MRREGNREWENIKQHESAKSNWNIIQEAILTIANVCFQGALIDEWIDVSSVSIFHLEIRSNKHKSQFRGQINVNLSFPHLNMNLKFEIFNFPPSTTNSLMQQLEKHKRRSFMLSICCMIHLSSCTYKSDMEMCIVSHDEWNSRHHVVRFEPKNSLFPHGRQSAL